jgi:PAS domain S-box-containing protein
MGKTEKILERELAKLRAANQALQHQVADLQTAIATHAQEAVQRSATELAEWKGRYEAALQAMGQVLYDWNSQTDVVLWSGPTEQLLGYTPDELPTTLAEAMALVHPADRAAFAQEIARTQATKSGFQLTYRLHRKDGAYVTVEDRGHFFMDRAGTVIRMVGFLVDVSERTQMEEALRESEERYRSLFENANDAIVTFTLDGIVTSVNRGLEVMVGWSREELIGQHYRKFVTPASVALGEERTRRFLAGERLPSIFEGEHVGKDGRVVPVEVRTRPIRDRAGQLIGFQGIYRDLTVRKQAEAALRQSAAHFRALVEQALDFVVVLNQDGTIRYESPAMARLLGFIPEERVGRNGFEHLHPEDLPRVRETFTRVLQHPGATASLEFRIRHKDGSWRTLEAVGTNLLADPAVAGVVVNCRDTTERKRMEEALQTAYAELERRVQERTAELSQANTALAQEIAYRRQAEHALRRERNLLEVTLASIGDAVMATDLSGALTFINPVAETLTGWTAQEAVGRPLSEVFQIINEHSRQPAQNPLERVLREGVVVGLANHTVLIARDGREVPIADSGAPIRDASGQVQGMVMVFRDVTAGKQAEAALRQAKETAEAADQAKSEFLATVSHELRTPLYIILSYTDFLAQGEFGPLAPDQQPPLQALQRSAGELYELIIGMLDLGQLQRDGQLPVDIRAVPLPVLFAVLQQETQERYGESGLEFVWDIAPDLPPLWTDLGKLKAVLKNLLGNAVKFTSAGRVTVAAAAKQGGVEISVSDTGPGIPPEALSVIFEPFRQGDSSLSRSYGGVGLGLYIVKSFLTLLGGQIKVESEVGRGSTFRVWLPLTSELASSSGRC